MIHSGSKAVFDRYVKKGYRVIELGDQIMNVNEGLQDVRSDVYYRDFVDIVSVDIHGDNRALPLDLSLPQKLFPADVVTDFGTMEHVRNLGGCLENVFGFCRLGGVMIHSNPRTGHFPDHGFHYFNMEFWEKYAGLAWLEILELYEFPAYHNTDTGMEVIAVLRKGTEAKFPSAGNLKSLIKGYVFTK